MNLSTEYCKRILAGEVAELDSAFVWYESPQGHDYWEKAHKKGKLTKKQREEIIAFIQTYEQE